MAGSTANIETTTEPPYCSLKMSVAGVFKEKLRGVKLSLSNTQSGEQFHKMLLAESRLLYVSIYKRSAQLRREKSIQLLKRVKSCLQRLQKINRFFSLSNDLYKDISSSMDMKETEVFLPSQQMWIYLLHLTSNYYSLLSKTIEYSVTAFEHLSSHFATGMLIPTMVLFMGIMARVWQICRTLQVRLAAMYATVYSFHWETKSTTSDWVYPSIPTELSSPLSKTISGVDERFGTKLDVANKEQDIPEKRITGDLHADDISIPSVRSTSDDVEDLGVTVFCKKRKGWRATDDSVLSSKKRKTKCGEILLQERPPKKAAKSCPANDVNSEHHSLNKRRKEKNAGQVKMPQNSEQLFDKLNDEFEISKKDKLSKKKGKKLAVAQFEIVSDNKFSKEKKLSKCKQKSVSPSTKMKKKQVDSNKESKKQEVPEVTKKKYKKSTATDYVMTDKEKKNRKKKRKERFKFQS